MKKLLYLTVILLVLSLMVSGCNNSTTDDTDAGCIIDHNYFYTTDYNEYLSFLQTTDRVDNFVSYDNLQHLGEFSNFGYDPDNPNYYTYGITDEGGHKNTIYITHNPGAYYVHDIADVDPYYMKAINTDHPRHYLIGNIMYTYTRDGILGSIKYYTNDISISIGRSLCLENCDTGVLQLLNIEGKTAEEVEDIFFGRNLQP